MLLIPRDADAACWYPLTYRIRYYSEPELINQVGQCFRSCSGSTTCSGTSTEHSQITNMSVCPAQCE